MPIQTTLGLFQQTTGLDGKAKHRGGNIKAIDDALKEYWQKFAASNPQMQKSLTWRVFKTCSKWLKDKQGKSDTKRSLFGTRINENLVRRRDRIKDLAMEALEALGDLDPDFADYGGTGWRRFETRKVTSLARGPQAPHQIKGLALGYHLERQTYMGSRKTTATPATNVKGMHDLYERLENKTHKKKTFEQLTASDYMKLDQLAQKHNIRREFTYVKKAGRFQYLAIPEADGFFYRQDGTKVQASRPQKRSEFYAYAMDEYGNLLVKFIDLYVPELFNHSSFNAGKDVICAGEIVIEDGRLMMINNTSGHYQPTRQNLHEALRILVADGANIDEAEVQVMERDSRGEVKLYKYRAWTFHENMDAQPDLGTV